MKIPTVDKVDRVRPKVLATRSKGYWVLVFDAQGYAAWVRLDKPTWVQDAPAPSGLVHQVKAWLRANWDKVIIYELTFRHEERHDPHLLYGSPAQLQQVIGA